jgi:hypothetical protein
VENDSPRGFQAEKQPETLPKKHENPFLGALHRSKNDNLQCNTSLEIREFLAIPLYPRSKNVFRRSRGNLQRQNWPCQLLRPRWKDDSHA